MASSKGEMFPCESRVSTPEYLDGYSNMVWDNSPAKFHTEDEREFYRLNKEIEDQGCEEQ